MRITTLTVCAAFAAAPWAGASLAQDVPDAQGFADTAASANMFEIQSSELALDADVGEETRAFAQHMIDDHTAAGEKMKMAAAEAKVTPATAMMTKEQGLLEALQDADGDEFEQLYLTDQLAAHEDAVKLFKTYSEQGEPGPLRDFAGATLPTLEEHLSAVQELSAP
jgi:putative membrane protein